MRLPSLLGHSAHLIRLIWNSPNPADALASEYFRSKKYIGSHDRRFISSVVFATLRGRRAFEYCAREPLRLLTQDRPKKLQGTKAKKRSSDILFQELALITSCCLLGNQVGVGNIHAVLQDSCGIALADEEERIIALGTALAERLEIPEDDGINFALSTVEFWQSLEHEIAILFETGAFDETAQEIVATRFAVPSWVVQVWYKNLKEKTGDEQSAWFQAIELAASLLPSAPLCIRTNRLGIDRESVVEILRSDGLHAYLGKLSSDCVVLEQRVNLTQTNLYKQGLIEIQDEASQLAAFALNPQQGWRVLDACAGAGGKALHIGVLQHNTGEIIASDIEYQRLKELPFRAERNGITNVKTVHLREKNPTQEALPAELQHLHKNCDAVFVDAPCSGMGTVRRMPMAKWRLTAEALTKFSRKQTEILASFAHAVKPGGVLLYATCSIMPQENTAVVKEFLAAHPEFSLEPLSAAFATHGIKLPGLSPNDGMFLLTPAMHGTDGFFLARMRRNEE